jgi:hypothetical protein
MRKRVIAAAVFVAAFAAVSVAVAASNRDMASGAGSITFPLNDVQGNPVGTETDHFSFTGHSGPAGEDPSGQVTIMVRESPVALLGTDDTHFKGDVKDGCVRVDGNRATVVGELDEDQQFIAPGAPTGAGPVKFAAVFVEDNDELPGNVPDRAFSVLLFERTGNRVCGGLGSFFYTLMVPLDSGNVVVRDATVQ